MHHVSHQCEDNFRLGLRKSFLYRAQAVFWGRICQNVLYLLLWLISSLSQEHIFPSDTLDIALILMAFAYSLVCYLTKNHRRLGRWAHFVTLIMDLALHLFFMRRSGFLLSPLMAIHPFLASSFLLLFHNPWLTLVPLFTLPVSVILSLYKNPQIDLTLIFVLLSIYCTLDILAVFFIHLAHSKEQSLLSSLIKMEKKLKELAIVKERQRISREFHDGVGAKMTSITMQCDYLEISKPKESEMLMAINEIKESARESIEDMRRSIAFLNGNFDIVEQIQMTMEKVRQRHGLKTTIGDTEILASLGYQQQIACCRIIQEAVTNTLKHARANSITIHAQSMDKKILLTIKDDGTGFDPNHKKTGHYGIRNMIDRANQSRGKLTFSSKPSFKGTVIFVEMPIVEKNIRLAIDSPDLA